MNKKIALVTGAYGTIGRYVALTLASNNWTVIGIGHGKYKKKEQAAWGISAWHDDDVTLKSLVALNIQPSLIFHGAGSGAVSTSFAEPHSDFHNMVVTTAATLEYLRINCPEASFVYPSSAAVYGATQSLPMLETDHLQPVSPYGVHKKISEELIQEYAQIFGLKCSIVRLFSIYGEGFRKQLIWDACQRISANESLFFGTGRETRDWLHISDAANLIIRGAAHASHTCPIVNGGSGIAVSIQTVLSVIFKLMGRHDLPLFCGTQRKGDPLHYHADMQRAFSWNWQPNIPLETGLAAYVSWFKQYKARL